MLLPTSPQAQDYCWPPRTARWTRGSRHGRGLRCMETDTLGEQIAHLEPSICSPRKSAKARTQNEQTHRVAVQACPTGRPTRGYTQSG